MKRLLKHKLGMTGASLLLLFVILASAAPWISPYDPSKTESGPPLSRPSRHHLLGTDELGRDVFSRTLHGAKIAITVGLVASGLALLAGSVIGTIAGYYGGWLDSIVMRITDAWLAFPIMILALTMAAVLGPNLRNVVIAIAFVSTPNFIRLARGQALALRERQFVEAARALAVADWRILARHMMPNLLPVLIVQGSLTAGHAILTESALSFLGVGVMPPQPSWGAMLSQAQGFLAAAPWMAVGPGAAIFLIVMGFNLMGDGLRDVYDPRLRGS